jgi:hypothetical protein
MKKIRTFVFLMGLTASASAAFAQPPTRYTPPSGQTLPGALNYFRRDVGVLDQYNQFVAPQARLNSQLQNMAQQQNRDFQAVERQFRERDQVRETLAAPTGVAAGFMNYSHYFPSPASRGAPRARR